MVVTLRNNEAETMLQSTATPKGGDIAYYLHGQHFEDYPEARVLLARYVEAIRRLIAEQREPLVVAVISEYPCRAIEALRWQ